MLFTSDLVASYAPDVKRLRRFEKIFLKSGESKKVNFSISAKDLTFTNNENQKVVEPGDFQVTIGNLRANFALK
uniref:Fibronectin type III-like domain containing protein n=1 Tax=Coptotermes formosanus TaxID=36987 RepID=R4V4R7_COPFO|nr:fibronectin type III-like domain containing protein [Coptotermes formosanus]